jgi:predicted glycoside hydrolase/deacetylase ChbG (UPF0249 family)
MKRQLIVNADDFGRTPGVTEGILRAHREGIVTSATAMMNLPYAREALRLAQDCPRLGVGVHLNFTFDRPLLPAAEVSTLVDENGCFFPPEAQILRAEEVDPGQLHAEWVAQIEAFRSTGREPDHLDCHHPAHVHPRFFAIYLQVAEEYKLPLRMPIPRQGVSATMRPPAVLGGGIPLDVIRQVVEQDLELLQRRKLKYPDHFLGDFYGEKQLTTEWLLCALRAIEPGVSELMTHPGFADSELLARSEYGQEREREVLLLCDRKVIALIKELGIELVNFGMLWR